MSPPSRVWPVRPGPCSLVYGPPVRVSPVENITIAVNGDCAPWLPLWEQIPDRGTATDSRDPLANAPLPRNNLAPTHARGWGPGAVIPAHDMTPGDARFGVLVTAGNRIRRRYTASAAWRGKIIPFPHCLLTSGRFVLSSWGRGVTATQGNYGSSKWRKGHGWSPGPSALAFSKQCSFVGPIQPRIDECA